MVTQWTLGHRSNFHPFCPTGLEASEGKREGRSPAGTHQPRLPPSQTTPSLLTAHWTVQRHLTCTHWKAAPVSLAPSPSLPCDWHTDRYKVCPVPQTVLPFCVHFRDHLPHPPYNLPEPILCPFPSLFSLTPFGEETPRHMHYSPCGALLWGNCSKIKGFLGNFQKGSWIRQYLDYENFRSIQRGFCFLCF